MILYAVVIAFMNKKILKDFSRKMKASSKMLIFCSVLLFIALVALSFYLTSSFGIQISVEIAVKNSLLPVIATISIFILFKFAKSVEEIGFRRKIPISKLRVGDMLDESRELEGITEKQLEKIKKSGKRVVVIKEGIRFGPAFPLALLFTLFFGDAILFLIRFMV